MQPRGTPNLSAILKTGREQREFDHLEQLKPIQGEPSMHPSIVHILQFFQYEHLPAHLQVVSAPFHNLAHQCANRCPDNPETTVALRKLLEAKDAAVRAAL